MVRVTVAGVGRPRRVKAPRSGPVPETVLLVASPAVAVMVALPTGPSEEVTVPLITPSPLRSITCTPLRFSPASMSRRWVEVAYPVLVTLRV